MNFKVKKAYYRLFSVLLSVVMIVLSVPISAVAQDEMESVTNVDSTSEQAYNASTFQKSPEVLAADAEAMRREQLIQNGIDPDQPLSNNSTAQFVQGGEELQPLVSYDQVLSGGDGVYAIKHLRGNYFIKTEHPEWLAGYHMQQQYTSSSTIMNNFSTGYLFKLTQHPQTGSYIIRLMYNNALSFSITPKSDGSGYEVLTKDIQLDDALVPLSDTYVISASGSGFKIRKYGTTNCIAVNGSQTNLTATTKIGDSIRWTFSQYTGAERNSAVMLYSSLPTVGQTTTLIPVIYSTRPGYNMPHLDMSQIPSSSYYLSGPNEYGRFSLTPHDGPDWTFHIYVKNASLTSSPLVYASKQDFKIKLPIDEGTYFFNNVKYDDKFMQIDNNANTSQSGAKMEIRAFEGSTDQRWNVQHISDGYYKITSVASGLALTASTSTNGAITQTTYTGTNYQKWKILKQSDGTYKISPKSNSSFYMAAGNAEFLSARNVETRTAQSDGKDEWVLYRCDLNIVNVEVVYDVGYSNRFSDVPMRINEEMMSLQEKYLIDFGIWIEYTEPTAFISYGDSCSSNPLVICNHASNEQCYNSTSENDLYEYHHKNILNILERITRPDTSSSLKIAYIGHNNCSAERDEEGNLEHLTNPFFGMAFTGQGLACVMNFSGNSQETKTLVHEFGHLFGVEDHYGGDGLSTTQINGKYPNSEYDEYCIYGEKKDKVDVYQNLVICDGCKDRIRENLNRYDHN